MSEEIEYIISGRTCEEDIFSGSLPEYLLSKWREIPEKKSLLIEISTGKILNSKELLTRSLQVSEGLKNIGLKQNDIVCIYGKTGIDLIIAQYGILFAGGVLAPVDPNLKTDELEHLRDIIQCKIVICESETLEHAQKVFKGCKIVVTNSVVTQSSVIDFNTFYENAVDIDTYMAPSVQDPGNEIAIIACSSGTSGSPKGTGLTHSGLISQLHVWAMDIYVPRILQITQLFWISALLTTLLTCVTGLCRVFVREFDEEEICKGIDQYRVESILIIPPDILRWVNHPSIHKYDLSSLKICYTGATPVFQSHLDAVKNVLKHDINVYVLYGMTELSGMVARSNKWSANVGKLLTFMKMKVVDPDTGKSLPPYKTGEICLKSPSIMKGYVNNDVSTKLAIDDEGYYHSGDLGFYDEDEILTVNGRLKEIFKYKATHISPSDMEMVISQLSGVQDVGVVGIPHPVDVNRPVALVVKRDGFDVTEREIIDIVEKNMSSTKRLAGGVRFVEVIPKTTTGKIKRPELQKLAETLLSVKI